MKELGIETTPERAQAAFNLRSEDRRAKPRLSPDRRSTRRMSIQNILHADYCIEIKRKQIAAIRSLGE